MKSILDFNDYRAFLRDCVEQKLQDNGHLSLRSLAEKIGLSPSYLSRVLSGQRKLSLESSSKLARYFKLSSEEALYFFDLVELENAKSDKERERILRSLSLNKSAAYISLDQFKLVSDWYHFAILSYARAKTFKSDPQWLAHRLNISSPEVKMALERLVASGFMKVQNGKYKAVDDAAFQTTHDIPSSAIQENHRQHLKLAEQALESFEPDLREFVNRTLNLNIADIPEAKRRIRNFIKRFDREMDQAEKGNEVFHIDISFYQVTKRES